MWATEKIRRWKESIVCGLPADKDGAVVRVGIVVYTASFRVAARLLHQFLPVEGDGRAVWRGWLELFDGAHQFLHLGELASSVLSQRLQLVADLLGLIALELQ